LTLQPGLPLKPGMILYTLPAGEWQFIAEYDPASGKCVLCKPFYDVSPSMGVFADPRVWRVVRKNYVHTFPQDFFRSAGRSKYAIEVEMPFSGVVAVRAYLETQLGKRSNTILKLFTADGPHRLRTLGTTQYVFSYPGLTPGITLNAFETARAEQAQSFQRAYARKLGGAAAPIQAPRAVEALVPTGHEYGGTILITGMPEAGDQLFVEIGDPATETAYIQVPPYTVNDEDGTDLGLIAAAVCDWLNGTEQFAAFYLAESASNDVRIVDRSGAGGTIRAQVSGKTLASATGLAPRLGITKGRRYAVSYRASGDGYESDLSPVSASTGPTGGATRIEINDLPTTAPDARVDRVMVWAAEDGQESGVVHEVADVPLGTEAVVDTFTEEALLGQGAYPGPSHPTASGPVKVTVNKDGGPWFELRIPDNQALSNVVDGLALNNVSQGTEVTVDIDNGADEIDLDVVIQ
jgi:hypothetical protein